MKVLVTGANGLLGHHVIFELLKRNHSVSIIVRNTKSIFFDLNRVQVSVGNFTDYQQLRKAAEGCQAIIHIAGVTATDLLHYEDYQKVNVVGANQITHVAEDLDIKNLIFVSSSNTIGFGKSYQFANETYPIEFPFSKSFYAQSKMEAEQIFLEASKHLNQQVVIINPTFMIGDFDTKPSSGKLILLGLKKRWMFIPKGGKNFVAVRDVAFAVCNAMTQGKNGERYLASGINLTFAEFYKMQSRVGEYHQFLIQISDLMLFIIGKFGDFLRLLGIKTELCSMNLRQLMIREYYSNEKAKAELDLPETDLKIAIKDAIDWFEKNPLNGI